MRRYECCYLLMGCVVQSGEGLVEQQEVVIGEERPRKGDASTLAARARADGGEQVLA